MKTLSALSLLLILSACGANQREQSASADTTASASADTLSFVQHEYQEKTNIPCEVCPQVSVNISEAQGNSAVARSINDSVFAQMKRAMLFSDAQKDRSQTTYPALLQAFVAEYERQKRDMPDATLGWEAQVKTVPSFQSDKLVAVQVDAYMMTGGAHGLGTRNVWIFNKTNGQHVTNTDLIADNEGLKKLAEEKFRDKYKVPAGKPINSTGFMFEGDKFYLPNNIIPVKDGLLLHYNPYDVAAYVQGPLEVLIDWNTARPYINKQFL